jgi:hypothetical protein
VGFEPCVLNLILKQFAKDPKKEGRKPNFLEFWSEEVHHI